MKRASEAEKAFLELADKLCDNDTERAKAIGFMLTGLRWAIEQAEKKIAVYPDATMPITEKVIYLSDLQQLLQGQQDG